MPDRSSRRASNALRPAGRMLPASISSVARLMFAALHVLRAVRGVNRIVAHVIEAPPNAVDPPKRQRLVHGLRPGDAGLPRALLVEPHQELLRRCMVRLQPGAQRRWRGEEYGS